MAVDVYYGAAPYRAAQSTDYAKTRMTAKNTKNTKITNMALSAVRTDQAPGGEGTLDRDTLPAGPLAQMPGKQQAGGHHALPAGSSDG
ncbi:uncharacterized protein UV8b_02693 [Ustilaginoidea virens]|uniref:Uncharacterized protein n=1 Tax=Ustilaginoidea virens TaxID=1159556 RepID=A0A8E5MG29_USTVR|nr:uncharacterized protein UV8b_02693 [Ustilaginoidea virens]QUC18452.1 hypothetical protein UV8b_02693 [Ustilaginoidea virens]